MFDQPRDGGVVERHQPLLPGDGGDQPRQHRLGIRRAVDIVVEIRQHLEVLRELGIQRGQQVVQHTVAEQHDLHVEWNRVRRHWRDAACQA